MLAVVRDVAVSIVDRATRRVFVSCLGRVVRRSRPGAQQAAASDQRAYVPLPRQLLTCLKRALLLPLVMQPRAVG